MVGCPSRGRPAYRQSARDRIDEMKTAATCTFDGCDRAVKALGLCSAHHLQKSRGKELKPLRTRRMAPVVCEGDECSAQARVFSSGMSLCAKHHHRWLYHGDPNMLPKDSVRPLAMAAIKDAVSNRNRYECWLDWAELPCWEGTGRFGGAITRGYPTIGQDKVMRLVLHEDGRPRPDAQSNHCRHLCHNSLCWNPDHLEWGTHGQNMADNVEAKGYCKHCTHCNPT